MLITRTKRFFTCILTSVMILSLLFVPVQVPKALAADDLTVTIGTVEATPGGEAVVPITITNIQADNCVGTDLYLVYDQSSLIYTDYSCDDADVFPGVVPGSASLELLLISATEDYLHAGDIVFNLLFDVSPDAAEGDYAIQFDPVLTACLDSGWGILPAQYTNGKVTVTGGVTTYTVTIDETITGGTVTADTETVGEGDSVVLTVTPDSGKQLTAESLVVRYNDGSADQNVSLTDNGDGTCSFIMPAYDVTVTAQFEDESSGDLTVTIGTVEAASGGEAVVPITITNIPADNCIGTDLYLVYDQSSLIYTDYSCDDADVFPGVVPGSASLEVLLISATEDYLHAGDIVFNLLFDVSPDAAEGYYAIQFDPVLTACLDSGWGILPAQYTNGKVTVTGGITTYTVTIDETITGGTVTADAETAPEGDSVVLTVTPDSGKQLTAESLVVRYNDGSADQNVSLTDNGDGTCSFNMPAYDVTVTAQFENFTIHTVTFQTINAHVEIDGTPVTSTVISEGEDLTFTVIPETGFEITSITTGNGNITDHGNGSYTLSDVTDTTVVTVTVSSAWIAADLTIYTAEELFAFAADVNSGNNYSGEVVRLGADINLEDAEWESIGCFISVSSEIHFDHPFSGTFDGDGYTVSGINVNGDGMYLGFFGKANNAIIKNLTVDGIISGGTSGYYIGGIAGAGASSIQNCVNNATVTGGSSTYYIGGIIGTADTNSASGVFNCTNNGDVNGGSSAHYVGGIAGYSVNVIECANHGTVSGGTNSGDSYTVGGIMGGADTSGAEYLIDRCYNTGAVNGDATYGGGITGKIRTGSISNCYNTGTVSNGNNQGTERSPAAVSGITGGLFAHSGNIATVSNCYNTGTVQQTGAGYCLSDEICSIRETGCTSTNNYISTDTFVASDLGEAYVGDTIPQINGGYPILVWQNSISRYIVTFNTADTVTVMDSHDQVINNNGTEGVYTLASGTYSYTSSGGAKGNFNVTNSNKNINLTADIVFTVSPGESSVVLTNSTDQTMSNNGAEGCYTDLPNDTYSWTVTADGYTTVTGSVLVAGMDRCITVTMSDSSTVYYITVDGSITGGALEVSPESGVKGTPVTVIVTPDTGNQMVEGSLRYMTDLPGSGYTSITVVDDVFGFVLPAANVAVTAEFEKIPTTSWDITVAPVSNSLFAVITDVETAMAGDTVTVTVSEPSESYSSWCEGLIIIGDTTGTTCDYITVSASIEYNSPPGVYTFIMPDEPVTIEIIPATTPLDVYLKIGDGDKTLVHSYTREEIETIAAVNTAPVYYAMWDKMPAAFMGKAVSYITLEQLTASAGTYNSDVKFDGPGCTMKAESVDGWVRTFTWDYLVGTPRYYYADLGDEYLDPANRLGTGNSVEVPVTLAITGWSGRTAFVDGQPYDTCKAYRFLYGLSAEQYDGGSIPTGEEFDSRCTATDSGKWLNEIVFTVPETWNVTVDPAITGGTLAVDPVSGSEGTPVTVTVTPDTGKKLLTGSLKYTTGDDDWTVITDTDGVYSFMLPAADVTVTVQFIDAGSPDFGITVDDTITGGSITADPVSAPAGAEITVIIVPDSGNRLASGSLKYTIDGGTTWINISCSDGGFSFIMPSSDVTVTARFETIPEAVYTIIPQTDSGYTIGSDPDGICTMTVSGDVSGFVYFRVTVTPVISHTGSETAVFVLTRDETELRYSTTVADLDVINTVSAGFNVQAGDVIKVYIVDSISNNPDFEPVFFQ